MPFTDFILALYLTGTIALSNAVNVTSSAKKPCFSDNKLRALERFADPARTFCVLDPSATASPLPTYLAEFKRPDISSACSCFVQTLPANFTITVPTTTATPTPTCTPTQPIKDQGFESVHTTTPQRQYYYSTTSWFQKSINNNSNNIFFIVDTQAPRGYLSPTFAEASFNGSQLYQDISICRASTVQRYRLSFLVDLIDATGSKPVIEARLVQGNHTSKIPLLKREAKQGYNLYAGPLELARGRPAILDARLYITLIPGSSARLIHIDQVSLEPSK